MKEEKRKSHRCLSVMNVTVKGSSGSCEAELLDVNTTGLGLCWIQGVTLDEGEEISVEFTPPGGGKVAVSGRVVAWLPDKNARPNARSAGLKIDASSNGFVTQMAYNLSGVPEPPAPVSTPEPVSVGFRRAWGGIGRHGGRDLIRGFIVGLQSGGGDGMVVADHLLTDSNCPAQRLLNLLEIVLGVGGDPPWGAPYPILETAFERYKELHTSGDVVRDRRIDADKAGPLVSRVLPGWVVETWVMDPPQQHLTARDLIEELLDERAGSLENFQAAVAAQTTAPYLGRTKNDLVWCAPREDVDKYHVSNVGWQHLLDALGMKPWTGSEVMEVAYPSSVKTLLKPCSVHAGVSPLFLPTPEDEDFGRTPGSGGAPGLREAVHGPLRVAEALRPGASLRKWRD